MSSPDNNNVSANEDASLGAVANGDKNEKQSDANANATSSSAPVNTDSLSEEMNSKLALVEAMQSGGKRSNKNSRDHQYKFWNTQPVMAFDQKTVKNDPINADQSVEEIRAESYSLPAAFYWADVDLNNDSQLDELYTLLYENYVEDDDNMFRFDYSREFLKWAMMPPGWHPEWFAGIRIKSKEKSANKSESDATSSTASKDKLVCFIAAIPIHVKIHEKSQ